MVNYACAFSQSATEKYFEWIISSNNLLLSETEFHLKNYEGQGGCYLLRLQGWGR